MAEIVIKSIPVNPLSCGFFGYKFFKNGTLYVEERCRLCGRWFQWQVTIPEHQKRDLLLGKIRIEKPLHCNKSSCVDFQERREKHLARKHEELENKYQGIFLNLLKRGYVSK